LEKAAIIGYTIDREGGSIHPAEQCPSPNQDARPNDADPGLVVLHGISLPPGQYGGGYIEQLFCNVLDWDRHPYFSTIRDLRVSAHLLVRRDGALVQFVPFDRRAWHAGDSRYRGQPCCNDYSIGIELEGVDDEDYADEQYRALNGIISALLQTYSGMNLRQIAAHSDIAPNRKTDPGPAFDWFRLYDGVISHSSEKS